MLGNLSPLTSAGRLYGLIVYWLLYDCGKLIKGLMVENLSKFCECSICQSFLQYNRITFINLHSQTTFSSGGITNNNGKGDLVMQDYVGRGDGINGISTDDFI